MFNNKSQSVRANESTMDFKHASASAVQNFSFFFLFVLNKCTLKVRKEYTCQDFDTNRENKFLIIQLMSTVVKTIMVLYV
jgi:hypothetical protein